MRTFSCCSKTLVLMGPYKKSLALVAVLYCAFKTEVKLSQTPVQFGQPPVTN